MGNYAKAKEYIDESYSLFRKFPEKHLELGIYYTDAKFRNICGDWEESSRLLEKAIALANETNRKYYLSYCYSLLVENSYYLNRTHAAFEHLEAGRAYADKKNKAE